MVLLAIAVAVCGVSRLAAVEAGPETTVLAEFAKRGTGAGVRIALEHAGGAAEAVLVAEFTIQAPGEGWHFYSTHLPETGTELGGGRPAKIAIPADSALIPVGERVADADTHEIPVGGGGPAPVYPPGPVTVRQMVRLPQGDGAPVAVELRVWYMICDDRQCLRPVQGDPITVEVPTHPQGGPLASATPEQAQDADPEAPGADPEAPGADPEAQPPGASSDAASSTAPAVVLAWPLAILGTLIMLLAAVVTLRWPLAQPAGATPWRLVVALGLVALAVWLATRPRADYPIAEGIDWVHVASVAEVRSAIREAHAEDQVALLDFTGPACANCQEMAKNIFIIEEVRAGWNSGVPIEIDTDSHPELEAWQGETFGTWSRPLYVRIEPGLAPADWADAPRWDARVTRDDEAGVTAFAGFLRGEVEHARAIGVDDRAHEWLGFVLLALAGGLFTLVMPCTYPMIPFTVTFFSKQAAAGRRLVPLAACYALGIVGFFAGLGLVVGVVFGTGLTAFAGNAWVNLVIGVLFVVFGLSLLGAFLLRLPAGLADAVGGGRGGYLGALAMGLTFAITAFTCTAPFAGLVLGEAASDAATTGTWFRALIGMLLYASVIAVPFFFLSISPGLLQRLPRAGAWMGEFKVMGGLVELGAALKFLAIADVRWDWGLVTRTPTLACWSALALLCAVYLLGLVRMRDDEAVGRPGAMRVVLALAFLALGGWLASGLVGNHLGIIESFFPADAAPRW